MKIDKPNKHTVRFLKLFHGRPSGIYQRDLDREGNPEALVPPAVLDRVVTSTETTSAKGALYKLTEKGRELAEKVAHRRDLSAAEKLERKARKLERRRQDRESKAAAKKKKAAAKRERALRKKEQAEERRARSVKRATEGRAAVTLARQRGVPIAAIVKEANEKGVDPSKLLNQYLSKEG